jgi:hypothetical protein
MAKTKITNGQTMIYKNSKISHIWKVCRSFSFLYNLDTVFFSELIAPRTICGMPTYFLYLLRSGDEPYSKISTFIFLI